MVSVSIIEAVRRECRPQSEKLTLSSSGVARAPRPHEKSRTRATRFSRSPDSKFVVLPIFPIFSMCAPGLPSLRLACLAHTRCPAPCTRAHARTARSTRTLHACEPRQRRAHALTQQHALAHAQKHHVVPRVTGHWLTVGRPAAEPSSAQLHRKCTRHIPLLASHMPHPHAVHATHHHCCHRTQRHDDNERDEDA